MKLDSAIHAVASCLSPREQEGLRLLACEYVQRVVPIFEHAVMSDQLSFAAERATGQVNEATLTELRERAVQIYDSLYPGYGAPSAETLAIAAGGDLAFTESPVVAAIGAASLAAQAVAEKAAGHLDAEYDEVYQRAYAKERAAQLSLLHQRFGREFASDGEPREE